MFKRSAVIIVVFSFFLAGCGMRPVTDEHLRANTAGVLGVNPDDVTISHKNQQQYSTYYQARTKSGKEYTCVFDLGDMYTGYGVATCSEKGKPLHQNNPFIR